MSAPISYADALHLIGDLPAIAQSLHVPLADAHGRWLAADVALAGDQPPFDRATMDGFAVQLDGDLDTFAVVGMVPAGSRFQGTLAPGEAVRIMTGAPAPAGTTVIPIELTDQVAKPGPQRGITHRTISSCTAVTVTDRSGLAPGRNIAFQGEDGRRGAIVVQAGTRLGPATLAVAAMAGATEVSVLSPTRLAIVTTGDEVGGSGEAAINDSNGPFLTAFCRSLDLPCTRAHAADDAIALRAALVRGFDHADVVVTTGGVSAGTKDLIPVLAPSLGLTTIFHHVAMQPGKPVFLARRSDGKYLVGLPGNPVSVLATAHLILLPLLRRLAGLSADGAWENLPLATAVQNKGKRQLFLPAKRSAEGIVPIAWNGSGDLIAAAAGDCLIDLAPGATFAAGALVGVLPYIGTERGATGLIPPRT
jgi:molybdopterin molybdotransferase